MKQSLKLWKYLLIIWGGVILFLSFFPTSTLSINPPIQHIDKLVHFVMYLVFTLLIIMSTKYSDAFLHFLLIFLFILFFGAIVELVQDLLPYKRTTSFVDVIFNLLGCLGAIGIYRTFFVVYAK